jgi:hypothetical protein
MHLPVEWDIGIDSKRAEVCVVVAAGVGPNRRFSERCGYLRGRLPAPFAAFFFTVDDAGNALKCWCLSSQNGARHSLKKSNQGATKFVLVRVSRYP